MEADAGVISMSPTCYPPWSIDSLLGWLACPWCAGLIYGLQISAIDDCISHSMLHTRAGCTVLMCTMLDTLLIISEQCGLILCTGLMMVVDARLGYVDQDSDSEDHEDQLHVQMIGRLCHSVC